MVSYFLWSLIRFILIEECTPEMFIRIIVRPQTYFWFLWTLFWCFVVFKLLQVVSEMFRIGETIILATGCMMFFLMMIFLNIRGFGVQYISYYFIFFVLGYCINKYAVLKIRNRALIILMFVIWAILAWGWNMHTLPSWMPVIPHIPSAILQYIYRGITSVIAIEIMFSLSPSMFGNNQFFNKPLQKYGEVSLGIYTSHLIMLPFLVELFSLMSITRVEQIIATILILVIASYIMVWLLQKNKYTSMLLLGKYQKK